MMSKTDVTEAVLSLEVFHGGAKFIDANHNQPQHIPADSFFSCLLFPKVVQPEVGGDSTKGWNRGELKML